MKTILRLCYNSSKYERFIKYGIWNNGLYAYSKITLTEDGKYVINDEDEGAYYQTRFNGKLVMIHI